MRPPWFLLLAVGVCAGSMHAHAQGRLTSSEFVGSEACATCHEEIYDRWKSTRMANILVDVKERPEAILGDFSTPNPLVTFTKDDVTFTYGSKWKQRYFKKVGDDYIVFPVQWDVMNEVWRPYHPRPGTDWWVQYYPDDQMQRPTGPLCDGCHSTNYDITTKQVTEWNVGCEKCHGAGGAHVQEPSARNIVNPARLGFGRSVDICMQCHSQGQPREKPLGGVYYDWPVGYRPGDRLHDVWALETAEPGQETFTHWPEGSAHKNRMQANDFVTSVMYTRGVRCWSCHDVHGTPETADLVKPATTLCLTCHGPDSPNGPRGTIEAHTHHAADSPGSDCVECHMPKIVNQIADVKVRSHTFRFITPETTEETGVPNPCTSCHSDRSNAWASEQLLEWENMSPWRIGSR